MKDKFDSSSRFDTIAACDRHTGGQADMTAAYTALALRRVVKQKQVGVHLARPSDQSMTLPAPHTDAGGRYRSISTARQSDGQTDGRTDAVLLDRPTSRSGHRQQLKRSN